LARCQYSTILGKVRFDFEPQAGASERGDHLPKYIGPGEETILVHNWATMRVFLNQVMLDHDVEAATFQISLLLGDGSRIMVSPFMHIHLDMSQDDVATFLNEYGGKLVRQKLVMPDSMPILLPNDRRWRRVN
jgi:hypothetical protein